MKNGNTSSSDRARKRDIRARMDETGERYLAAARHVDAQHRTNAQAGTAIGLAVRCPSCTAGTLEFGDGRAHCPTCNTVWDDAEAAAVEYADKFLGLTWYSSVKDGGAPPVQQCPECGRNAVVWDEFAPRGGPIGLCLSCEETWNDTCPRCGGPMQDQDGVCGVCWSDVDSRD